MLVGSLVKLTVLVYDSWCCAVPLCNGMAQRAEGRLRRALSGDSRAEVDTPDLMFSGKAWLTFRGWN